VVTAEWCLGSFVSFWRRFSATGRGSWWSIGYSRRGEDSAFSWLAGSKWVQLNLAGPLHYAGGLFTRAQPSLSQAARPELAGKQVTSRGKEMRMQRSGQWRVGMRDGRHLHKRVCYGRPAAAKCDRQSAMVGRRLRRM
jgi:hypothetical protein